MPGINCFETDCVYEDKESGEFRNIHIKLEVVDDYFELLLISDEMINKKFVEETLTLISTSMFQNFRISIVKDCIVKLKVKNQVYSVNVIDTGIKVIDMIMIKQ